MLDHSLLATNDGIRVLFERYFYQMAEGYCLIRVLYDPSGKPVDIMLLDANESCERITGVTRAYSLGKTAKQLLPAVEETWLLKIGNLAKSDGTMRFSGYNTALRKWLGVQLYPLKKDDLILVIFTDLDRQREEAQSKELERVEFIGGLTQLERMERLYRSAKECQSEKKLIMICINAALEMTASPHGYMGLINASGNLDGIAAQTRTSSEGGTQKKFYKHELTKDMPFVRHYAGALMNGRAVILSGADSFSDIRDIPEGHMELHSLLGVPLREKGKVIGAIAVVNRKGEYNEKDKASLEGLANSIVEVLMRWRAEKEAQRNAKFKETILRLARDFINMPLERIDMGVAGALKLVGEYVGVDRTAVFRYDWGRQELVCVYSWSKKTARPETGACDVIPFSAIPGIVESHRAGRDYFTGLPGEPVINYPNDMAAANRHSPASTATFPLTADGRPWRALGFSTVRKRKVWTEDEIGAVHVFGEMLLAVLSRQSREQAMREGEEKYRAERALAESTILQQNMILQSINRVYGQVISCTTTEQLCAACLDIVESATGSAIGFIGEVGEDGLLQDVAISGKGRKACRIPGNPKLPGAFRVCGLYGHVIKTGKSLMTNDPAGHPESAGLPPGHPVLTSFLGVPFLRNGKVTGIIVLANRDGGYTARELEILEAVTPTVLEVLLRKRAETDREQRDVLLASQAALLAEQAGELEKKNKLITDFFINISHEFKTPLTILMLGLDLVEAKTENSAATGSDIKRNILMMRQNSYRLGRLVSNLLDITKLDAGFMEPKWEKIDVIRQLAGLVASTEPYARQKELRLNLHRGVEKKVMFTDGFMLERIFLNLLSNAIKHTPAGGSIDVTCKANTRQLEFSVSDTGEGIPEDKKAIIFDRFRQVDTSLTRSNEGCGIGLALTKSLVELLGGKIRFTSQTGSGSKFTVTLPVRQMDAGRRSSDQSGLRPDKRVQMELSDIGVDIV